MVVTGVLGSTTHIEHGTSMSPPDRKIVGTDAGCATGVLYGLTR